MHQCQISYIVTVMDSFEPWRKYPDLTRDRLSVIATIIRNVRHGCIMLHEPDEGDGPWSLGCRAYERIGFAIRKATIKYNWLKTLPEKSALAFSFAIGNVPFRFYRGNPEEPPYHYQAKSYGENHHIQLCLALDLGGDITALDGVLRLAVEISDLEVSTVTLVEVDSDGKPLDAYIIPFDEGSTNLVSIEAPPPIVTPPAIAEPLGQEKEKKDDGEKRERGHGIGSGS
jgi:hypothetical protein